MLEQQVPVGGDEPAHRVGVVVPDGIDEVAALDESHPARRIVAARQHELREPWPSVS